MLQKHLPLLRIFPLAVLTFVAAAQSRKMVDYHGVVFPPDHALNMPIDSLPVHPNSTNFITTIGAGTALHPDFGTSWSDGGTEYQMGIPYNIVGAGQPKAPITFTLYNDESDQGPWPIPRDPFIETVFDWREAGDGDRHMLIVDTSTHTLYETGNVTGNSDGTAWEGGCGAVFDLNGYGLRPNEWTSADAAGLPVFPLLIRYDEVERALAGDGMFHHAIRFTVSQSQKAYLWPARHYAASSTDKNRAPMGLRFRLKAGFDISGYTPRMQVILRSMKKYGMIVADNGSNWYFQGTHDERWNDDEVSTLKKVHGNDFEAVDISPWQSLPGFDPNSAQVPPAAGQPVQAIKPLAHAPPTTLSAYYRNGGTELHISVHQRAAAAATLTGFDLSGRKTGILYSGFLPKGTVTITRSIYHQARGTCIVQLKTSAEEHAQVVEPTPHGSCGN